MLSAEVSSPAMPQVYTWGHSLTVLRCWEMSSWNDDLLTLQTFYLELHAYVLSVFADVVEGGDGCFHMAAVFPIDQQPGTWRHSKRTREDTKVAKLFWKQYVRPKRPLQSQM